MASEINVPEIKENKKMRDRLKIALVRADHPQERTTLLFPSTAPADNFIVDEQGLIRGKELRRIIAVSKADCENRLNYVYEYNPEDAEGLLAEMEDGLIAALESLEDEASYRLEEIVVNESCFCSL